MSAMERFVELVGIEPDRVALLRWLADHVTPEEVTRVATADMGDDEGDNHRALRRILSRLDVPDPIDVGESWMHEVCSLMVHEGGTAETAADHRAVALALTVLVLAYAPGKPLNEYGFAIGSPSVCLVRAARALGHEAVAACKATFADLCVAYEPEEVHEPENLFLGFGILALLDRPPVAAIELLLEREQQLHDSDQCMSDSELWLYRLTYFDNHRAFWRRELLDVAARAPSPAADRLAALVSTWPEE